MPPPGIFYVSPRISILVLLFFYYSLFFSKAKNFLIRRLWMDTHASPWVYCKITNSIILTQNFDLDVQDI